MYGRFSLDFLLLLLLSSCHLFVCAVRYMLFTVKVTGPTLFALKSTTSLCVCVCHIVCVFAQFLMGPVRCRFCYTENIQKPNDQLCWYIGRCSCSHLEFEFFLLFSYLFFAVFFSFGFVWIFHNESDMTRSRGRVPYNFVVAHAGSDRGWPLDD